MGHKTQFTKLTHSAFSYVLNRIERLAMLFSEYCVCRKR